MANFVLNCPTVREVIEKLSTFPPNAKFVMEDADTGWVINVIHIDECDNEVQFSGIYEEMHSDLTSNIPTRTY